MPLSATAAVWESIAPALLLLGYLTIGGLAYAWSGARHGRFRDAETASRGETLLLGMGLRQYFTWLMRPVVTSLVRWSIPPAALTSLSLLLSCMAALEVAAGRFGLGGWLYLLGGACDFLDGRVARGSGSSSKAGAALDSIVDRYVEASLLLGLMWHYREGWVLIPAALALVGSLLVPYVRARGEGLGVSFPNVGIMQRPERVALLGASLVASPLVESLWPTPRPLASHGTVVIVLCVLAFSTQLTAVQRLRYVLIELGSERRSGLFGRAGVGRTLTTATLATLFDFAAVALLVDGAGVTPVRATLVGAALGAAFNFTLNRLWAFRREGPYLGQATRYLFVSGSSALLNAAGVGALLHAQVLEYQLAWGVARATVFLLWNYPLQRSFVFAQREQNAPRVSSVPVSPPRPHPRPETLRNPGGRLSDRTAAAIATCFRAGHSRWAPGSIGALLALPVAWAMRGLDPLDRALCICALTVVCTVAAHRYVLGGEHDPPEVVIDEWIGCLISLAFVPFSLGWVVAAYLLFRALDILKPGPIRWLERLPGGLGVIADDVAAGLVAGALLSLLHLAAWG